jgi:carboxyl-terminal processing protease
MRKLILFYFLTQYSNTTCGQFPAPVDSVYTFIKYNSIHRNKVNWDSIDTTFWSSIKNARSIKDTLHSFVSVLESLNDVHSQIIFNNRSFGNYPHFDDSTLAWLVPLNERANLLTNIIATQVLPGSFGYIRVPGIQAYGREQVNAFAQTLYDSVYIIAQKKLKGFVIDLRLNGGDNIYPMLSGLSSFLGNTIVGYETDVNDSIVRTWEIKNSNFIIGGYQSTELTARPANHLLTIPVVVLIGPVTKSAGSMTAIAFKQRKHTLFIGEPTAAGYNTSNGYFQFAPGLVLNFATNFVADRKLNIYKVSVTPDLMIYHGDNFDNVLEDTKVKAALVWLANNSH